jgi:uncharacterized YccA/Bax inhibitor family protein
MTLQTIGIARNGAGRSVSILLAALMLMSLACWSGWLADPHLSDENHLMENVQALALMLAWLVHGWRAWHADKTSVAFTLHAGLSLLSYSFLLRELDISELDAPGAVAWTWTEHILRGIGWACWVFFFIHAFRRIGRIWMLRWQLLATPLMIATLCGGFLMAAAWPFDKKKFEALPESTSEFIEELLELNAYIILFVASASDALPAAQTADALENERRAAA